MSWVNNIWTIYDLETTGVNPNDCHVVQIACVRMRDGMVIDRASRLVNPGIPIPPEVSAIHGIDDASVNGALCEQTAIERLVDVLEKSKTIIGYNNHGYDDIITKRLANRPDLFDDAYKMYIDVITLVKSDLIGKYWSGRGRHKLGNVATRYGIVADGNLHDATTDCILTGKILWKLASEYQCVRECVSNEWMRKERAAQQREFEQRSRYWRKPK